MQLKASYFMTVSLVLAVFVAIPTSHSISSGTATSTEFSLPIPDSEGEAWNILVGVGMMLRYPSDWQGRPSQAQGGIRDGATYELAWMGEQGLDARIEVLEIVDPITGRAVMETELSY